MRPYQVYKRGDWYRVARPGWFSWHWLHVSDNDDYDGIFETTSFGEAWAKADIANKQLSRAAAFRAGSWEEVNER